MEHPLFKTSTMDAAAASRKFLQFFTIGFV
jgi:hypothetical protein